jgi:hypothetical protein
VMQGFTASAGQRPTVFVPSDRRKCFSSCNLGHALALGY